MQLDTILASPRDSTQLNNLSELLIERINTGRIVPDSLFDRTVELARELNDSWSLAIVYLNRSLYSLNIGEVKNGLANVDEAIKYAHLSNQAYLLAESYATKVQLLMINGETKKSAELASLLAKQYHEAGELYYEAGIYQMLSMQSSNLGDYTLTMRYDSIAIVLARQSKYVDILVSTLSSAADNLVLLGYPERALVLIDEAIALTKKYNLDLAPGNILNARVEANTAIGNYAEALKDYELLKELEGEQKYTWWMTSRGILLQRVDRHEESRELLLKVIRMVKETSNDHLELKRCYQALQTVGLNQTQYDTVIYYRKLMIAQQDSLQAAENIKSLLELEKKYKAEEQAAEIRLQQEILASQEIKLYATVFGLLLALGGGLIFLMLSHRLTRRNKENEQLLTDKETLIGEIHHRVKNNLQVVSSLLQLQRRDLESDNDKGRDALLESQSRVSAMGLIHNKLYQDKGVTSISMPEYLEDLGEALLDAYRLEEQVEIFYDVAEISLDVDIAIPLGLIINELVANSLKYAFPNNREGTIEISLHREEDQLRLIVTDDGVGAVAAKTRADSTAFGTSLIRLLTKKLKGELKILEGRGYGIAISFAG